MEGSDSEERSRAAPSTPRMPSPQLLESAWRLRAPPSAPLRQTSPGTSVLDIRIPSTPEPIAQRMPSTPRLPVPGSPSRSTAFRVNAFLATTAPRTPVGPPPTPLMSAPGTPSWQAPSPAYNSPAYTPMWATSPAIVESPGFEPTFEYAPSPVDDAEGSPRYYEATGAAESPSWDMAPPSPIYSSSGLLWPTRIPIARSSSSDSQLSRRWRPRSRSRSRHRLLSRSRSRTRSRRITRTPHPIRRLWGERSRRDHPVMLARCLDQIRKVPGAVAEPPSHTPQPGEVALAPGDCVICLVAPAVRAVVPCGHQCLCLLCPRSPLERCPICRTGVERLLQIFVAGPRRDEQPVPSEARCDP